MSVSWVNFNIFAQNASRWHLIMSKRSRDNIIFLTKPRRASKCTRRNRHIFMYKIKRFRHKFVIYFSFFHWNGEKISFGAFIHNTSVHQFPDIINLTVNFALLTWFRWFYRWINKESLSIHIFQRFHRALRSLYPSLYTYNTPYDIQPFRS
jgi:hypothetical protein